MRSGWQSRREGPATQRNEALFESFLQRRDLWPPGGTQPILISDFTTPSVPFRIQRAPCCVVLHLLSLRWSLRSSAHPRSPRHKKTTDFNFRGRHITVPLHIPRTPFSLALTALFVSDSKGVLLCCVHLSFPPFSLVARVHSVGRDRHAQTLDETCLNHTQQVLTHGQLGEVQNGRWEPPLACGRSPTSAAPHRRSGAS